MGTHLSSIDDLPGLAGTDLGTSDWIDICQQRVNGFAEDTEDRQWIHVDPQRASRDSPFGGPIAHGYLTLSLISAFWEQLLQVDGLLVAVNYGLNKVRFPLQCPWGRESGCRQPSTLSTMSAAASQVVLNAMIEAEGGSKPVCVAEPAFRLYR